MFENKPYTQAIATDIGELTADTMVPATVVGGVLPRPPAVVSVPGVVGSAVDPAPAASGEALEGVEPVAAVGPAGVVDVEAGGTLGVPPPPPPHEVPRLESKEQRLRREAKTKQHHLLH